MITLERADKLMPGVREVNGGSGETDAVAVVKR